MTKQDMNDGYDEEIVEEESGSVDAMGSLNVSSSSVKTDVSTVEPEKPVLDFTAQALKHSHTFRELANRYSSICAEYPKVDNYSVSVLESYGLMCSLIAYSTDAVLAKSGPTTTPTLVLRLLEEGNFSAKDPVYSTCMAILSQLHEIPVQSIYLDASYLSELLSNILQVPAVHPTFFIHPSTPKPPI